MKPEIASTTQESIGTHQKALRANAAQGYIRRDECHGWMGIRFQTAPGAEPSEIINVTGLPILSRDVLAKLRKGDGTWEQMAPPEVANIIQERPRLGCQE